MQSLKLGCFTLARLSLVHLGLVFLGLAVLIAPLPAHGGELSRMNGAIAAAYSHYRGAVFYLRTGNPAVANIELRQAASLWRSGVGPFRDSPPDALAEDSSWPGLFDDIAARLSRAESAAGEGETEAARDELKPIRAALADLRARNGLRVFSDCVDEANAAMEALWVFRRKPPDFAVRAQVNRLRARTAVTAYVYRRCAGEAPAAVAAAPEFRRIVDGTLESLERLWPTIDDGDVEGVVSILREIRSFDRMLWLHFG